jgi:uncharacterized repeat protein (TIGR03803 family)
MCKRSSVLFLLLVAGIIAADAQTYTVLYNFGVSSTVGLPGGNLVQDVAGNLYGFAELGPSSADDHGTIFKFGPPGTLTTVYNFAGSPASTYPAVTLTLGADGNLYGITNTGGNSTNCPPSNGYPGGCGTIFKLTPGGTFSVLYNFDETHGSYPQAPLTLGSDGNFYGATLGGGSCPACGVIFTVTPQGDYSVLHYFDGTQDNIAFPLVQATDGSFYGTTPAGGANNTGTVFSITTAGQFTVVYNVSPDDVGPGSLIQGKDGNFYGTLEPAGGNVYCGQGTCQCFAVCGIVFRVTPQGSFSVLYDFADYSQGAVPSSLAQGTDDNLFGLAQGGTGCPLNEYGCGIIFQVTSSGAYSIVHNFDGTDGHMGNPGPIRGSDGNYYGTTFTGGTGTASACQTGGCGVLYALVMNDFSVAASAFQPGTISPGTSSTSAVNVAAVGGFSTAVALACSVQPTAAIAPSCSVSPSSVTPGTAGTLTVSTTAPTMAGLPSGGRSGPFYAFWLPLAGLAVAVVDLGSDRSEKRKMAALLLPVALLLGLVFTIACGGSSTMSMSSKGTPAGTYKITVTGMSGFLQHSTTTTLTVH